MWVENEGTFRAHLQATSLQALSPLALCERVRFLLRASNWKQGYTATSRTQLQPRPLASCLKITPTMPRQPVPRASHHSLSDGSDEMIKSTCLTGGPT